MYGKGRKKLMGNVFTFISDLSLGWKRTGNYEKHKYDNKIIECKM